MNQRLSKFYFRSINIKIRNQKSDILKSFIYFYRKTSTNFFQLNQTKMYTGFKVNTSINKSTVSGLNETQLQSLQRQVDTYTRKLELQKRKYFAIQDQHMAVAEQYTKEKQRLNMLKKQNTKAESIMLQAKVKNLDANLEKAISGYDDTIACNNRLKGDIDMLRREKKNYIEMQRILEDQLRKVDEETGEKMESLNKKKKKVQDLKQQIVQTKTKNEQQRQSYINKFSSLEKEYLGNSNDISSSKLKNSDVLALHTGVKPQIIDTQPLLKFRLKRIIASNKQKLRLIDQYKKHMISIEEAFNQIKLKSNISDLDQITTTFIKSEEQNYSLYNYMDSLTQNIDRLDDENRELQEKIQAKIIQDELKRQGLLNKGENGNHTVDRRNTQIEEELKKKQKQTQNLINLVFKIKPALQSALVELADSPIEKYSKRSDDYKLSLNITDRNIEEYLSQLEKHIHLLQVAKQEAHTKTITQLKDNVTVYSKPIPSANYQEVIKEKEKVERVEREESKFWEENKFRQYAVQFWQKKKLSGGKGLYQLSTNQQLGNLSNQQGSSWQNGKELNSNSINL